METESVSNIIKYYIFLSKFILKNSGHNQSGTNIIKNYLFILNNFLNN